MSRGRNTTTKVGGGGGGGGGGGWWHIPQCTNNTCILFNYQKLLSKSGHQLSKSGGARAPLPPPPSISAASEELDWAIAISLQKELSEAVSVLKNYDWLFSYTTHDIFPCKQFKPPTGQLLPTIWFKQNITKCQSL